MSRQGGQGPSSVMTSLAGLKGHNTKNNTRKKIFFNMARSLLALVLAFAAFGSADAHLRRSDDEEKKEVR